MQVLLTALSSMTVACANFYFVLAMYPMLMSHPSKCWLMHNHVVLLYLWQQHEHQQRLNASGSGCFLLCTECTHVFAGIVTFHTGWTCQRQLPRCLYALASPSLLLLSLWPSYMCLHMSCQRGSLSDDAVASSCAIPSLARAAKQV